MPLPEHTSALIYASGTWHLPGDDQADCEGSRFHSPTPMVTKMVRLIPDAWSPMASAQHSPRVYLCGTCADNLTVLQQIIAAHRGQVPWKVRREFGNTIRALGERGWSLFLATGLPLGAQ